MKYDLEYVLDSALDGVFIVASDRRLVLFNRACEELYGISRDSVLNEACLVIEELKKTLKQHGGEKQPGYGELASKKESMIVAHKGGRTVWVETTFTPIYDRENGDIAYVMGVVKDQTEQMQLEREKEKLIAQLGRMRQDLEKRYDFPDIVGRASSILHTLKLTGEVARQNTTVLILGESGTGKELLAKAIHYNSPRSEHPFVAINCSAFPDTLIESELFGYEKGAFTGAEKTKPGKVQLAAGGTLFLDEITEMSAPAQAKMLRVIQEREYQPLGGVRTLKADIRIIAATNKDIQKLVRMGKFREDLYYRLYVYPITIPPLRERPEDIPVLIDAFIKKLNLEMGRQIQGMKPEAMDVLLNYHWPGNVRELQNVVERLMILSSNDIVEIGDLPGYLREGERRVPAAADPGNWAALPERFSLDQYVQRCESTLLLNAWKKSGFNKTQAARKLGLSRSTFRYKLSKVPQEMLDSAQAAGKNLG